MTKNIRSSFDVNTSGNGKHKPTEQGAHRGMKRRIADAETAGLTKDKRVEMAGTEIDDACAQFEKTESARGYRPFVDQEGFVYLLTLVRKDILKNRLGKHRIKVRYVPHFSSQPGINSSMRRQITEKKRQSSDHGESPVRYLSCSRVKVAKGKLFGCSEDPGSNLRLPPCPVPLYFFPKPYPYSWNPVIEGSLPRYLRPSNPKLRVHIPDPWALSLQLFESDSLRVSPVSTARNSSASRLPTEANCQDAKSYACYSIFARLGQIHVQTLAPAGSTFDLAWDMFCDFFNKRVGVDWKNLHDERRMAINIERPLSEIFRGEDGADASRCFRTSKPTEPQFRDERGEALVESMGSRSRKPSVTVLINTGGPIMDYQMEIQAKTPESGW
ncbi:uncharacterized protein Z519_06904 [Cladophialophora bantiana CBS 173.52]|uniref:Uncharacterized protein n=1 Tax=Cladophialophora bantiana (strain ATCC 10958 / CBS 173.52 / CDC B-1940 / NIH 8579) TaxID=1442370 RepID=A0A0D2HQH5_CLAB1|nr:uncharacterized protein Z519_06904 [Cladophialophora bantiana CBS 173.52]KIW93055.1 hypothetical protein Z519_06904 [Cladophialophora bantiana CBS 173.52]